MCFTGYPLENIEQIYQEKTCIFVTIYIFPTQAFEKLCLFRDHRKMMSPKNQLGIFEPAPPLFTLCH